MIVDTSAVIAILHDEADARRYADSIGKAAPPRISAGNFLEAAIVLDRAADPIPGRRLDEFLREARFVIEPITEKQARIAREAYRDFGRDSGHPARLNYGDCFAYALAKATGEPLLFKGEDFRHTDVAAALP